MYSITVKGIDKIIRNLQADPKKAISAGLKAVATELQTIIQVYPPETIANSPENPRGQWYQRGYGVRWKKKDGTVGGKPTSGQLKKRWHIKNQSATSVLLYNQASEYGRGTDWYSGYVHASEKQAGFHAKRRWITDETAAKKVRKMSKLTQVIARNIAKQLQGQRI